MAFFNYNNNIPAANNNPSVDQPNMEVNTNSIDSIIDIDHFSFETGNDGTHKQVNLKTTAGAAGTLPAGTAGPTWNTLFTSTVVTPEIFMSRGGNPAIQLTGPGTPSNSANGRTFFAGGLRFQWGTFVMPVTANHATGLESFNVNFQTTCYNVMVSMGQSGPAQTDNMSVLAANVVDNTQFRWVFNGATTANYPNVWWMAIGD
jgi:hypothetical protein